MACVRATVPTDPANITGMSAEELRLTFRIREMEVEAMHLKVKLLELERQPRVPPQSPDRTSPCGSFDVSWQVDLVPPFRAAEVDSYFSAFVRISKIVKKVSTRPMLSLRVRKEYFLIKGVK